MSKVVYLNTRNEKLQAVHNYFENHRTSMLIIIGKEEKENLDILMQVAYEMGNRLRNMRILGDKQENKFAFNLQDIVLKVVYFAPKMSIYIEDMSADWEATVLKFDPEPKNLW